MKKMNNLLFRLVKLTLLGLVLLFQAKLSNAQVCDYVATSQVHFLPIAEDQVHDFLTTTYSSLYNYQSNGFSLTNLNPNFGINAETLDLRDVSYPLSRYSSIGIAVFNTIIYYYDDDYKVNLENLLQSTTEIWGMFEHVEAFIYISKLTTNEIYI